MMTVLRLRDAYSTQVVATIQNWTAPLPRPGDRLWLAGKTWLIEPEPTLYAVEGDEQTPNVIIALTVRKWTTVDPAAKAA